MLHKRSWNRYLYSVMYLKTCILFFATLASAYARLGETEAELIKRFGSPTFRGKSEIITQGKMVTIGSLLMFKQDEWSITCDLTDDRCSRIRYAKSGDWADKQFQFVLSANGQGAKWQDTSADKKSALHRTWKRSDGGFAVFQLANGMTLTNPAYERKVQSAQDRAKANANRTPKI